MKTLFALIVIVALGAGGYMLWQESASAPGGAAATTTDSGSTVAPSEATSTGTSVTVEAKIDQGASALGVKVIPHEVIEDSRCPIDVQCVWAGQVRLRATLESGLGTASQEFVLGQPVTTEAEIVTLTEVLPAKKQAVEIEPNDYTFVFTIQKR